MHGDIEGIVEDYDRGRISRREMIAHLGAFAAAMAVGSQAVGAEPSTFRANGLNHIALNTPDIAVSRDFYVEHLGLKVVREGGSSCFMTCDDNFVALFRSSNSGLNHFCFSVDDYDVADAAEKLSAKGLKSRRAGNRIYFNDPHGIEVQLAATEHRP